MGDQTYFLLQDDPIPLKSFDILVQAYASIDDFQHIPIIAALQNICKAQVGEGRSVSNQIKIIVSSQADPDDRTLLKRTLNVSPVYFQVEVDLGSIRENRLGVVVRQAYKDSLVIPYSDYGLSFYDLYRFYLILLILAQNIAVVDNPGPSAISEH